MPVQKTPGNLLNAPRMFAVPAQLYILAQKMQINFIPDSQSRYFHVGFDAREYDNAVQLLVGLFGETAKELKA